MIKNRASAKKLCDFGKFKIHFTDKIAAWKFINACYDVTQDFRVIFDTESNSISIIVFTSPAILYFELFDTLTKLFTKAQLYGIDGNDG